VTSKNLSPAASHRTRPTHGVLPLVCHCHLHLVGQHLEYVTQGAQYQLQPANLPRPLLLLLPTPRPSQPCLLPRSTMSSTVPNPASIIFSRLLLLRLLLLPAAAATGRSNTAQCPAAASGHSSSPRAPPSTGSAAGPTGNPSRQPAQLPEPRAQADTTVQPAGSLGRREEAQPPEGGPSGLPWLLPPAALLALAAALLPPGPRCWCRLSYSMRDSSAAATASSKHGAHQRGQHGRQQHLRQARAVEGDGHHQRSSRAAAAPAGAPAGTACAPPSCWSTCTWGTATAAAAAAARRGVQGQQHLRQQQQQPCSGADCLHGGRSMKMAHARRVQRSAAEETRAPVQWCNTCCLPHAVSPRRQTPDLHTKHAHKH